MQLVSRAREGSAPRLILNLIIVMLGTAIALAELYSFLGVLLQNTWLGAALVNTTLAAVIIANRKYLPIQKPLNQVRSKLIAFAPAATVLIAVAAAVVASRSFSEASTQQVDLTQWAWIIWVPIIEEIVFRWGAGSIFKKIGSPIWGSYFSVLLFAILHSNPTLKNIAALHIGIALGPLLLGICCEFILVYFGRISAAILFHMVCNFTVVFFSYLDSRWLKWLDFLYM